MLPPSFRTEEIGKGRIAVWVICLSLVLVIDVGFLISKRREGIQLSAARAESERLEEKKVADNKAAAAAAAARRAAEAKSAADSTRLSELATKLASIPGLRSAAGGRGYLKGKVLIIDKKEKGIDPLNSSLPETLRATSPEEVKTVVWLNWNENLVGHYEGGGSAYVYTCQMTIIDNTIPAIVAVKKMRGSEPPEYITVYSYGNLPSYGNGHGDKPDIIGYLRKLPTVQ